MKKYNSSFVDINGIRTHYIDGGSGDPLILIHGGGPGANAEYSWGSIITDFAGRHAYALDLVGFGESDKPTVTYTFQYLVDHVTAFLESLGLREIDILGNSMGGYIAVRYALDHPERIRKIMVIGSTTLASGLGIKFKPTESIMQLDDFDGTYESMEGILKSLVFRKELVTNQGVMDRLRIANSKGADFVLKSLSAYRKKSRDDPSHKQCFDISSRLKHLERPIKLIWGRDDELAPLSLGHSIVAKVPNIELAVIEEAGHQVMIDQPEELSKAVSEFLNSG